MSMERPHVLARVHKSASTGSTATVHASPTHTGASRTSSRELVTAIDSQGVNVYNLRSNQLTTSYSLSPSTKFHCPPVGVVDRLASTRRTYAALQTGNENLRITRWLESIANNETEVSELEIEERVRSLYLIDEALVVVFEQGTIQILRSDLSAVIETINASSYLEDESIVVLADSLQIVTSEENLIEILVLTAGSESCLHKIRVSHPSADTRLPPSIAQTVVPDSSTSKGQSTRQAVISLDGRILFYSTSPKFLELQLFNQFAVLSSTLRIPVNQKSIEGASIRWLNDGHIIVSTGIEHSIWDLKYQICQASVDTDSKMDVIAVVPQKSLSTAVVDVAQLVLSDSTNVLVTQITFSKASNLVDAIGRRTQRKARDLWIQDIDIQATWKDSLSSITADARTCLNKLESLQSGPEIDAVFEAFLFPGNVSRKHNDVNGKHITAKQRKSHQQTPGKNSATKVLPVAEKSSSPQANGRVTNGLSSPGASQMAGGLPGDQELSLANGVETEALIVHKKTFDSYDTDVMLSAPFVARLVQLVFRPYTSDDKRCSVPQATLDFLLRKGLVSLSQAAEAPILANLGKCPPELRVRLANEVVGLLPEQLLDILATFTGGPEMNTALAAIIAKLDAYDETMVVSAIRAKLQPSEIGRLMSILGTEMQGRLSSVDYKAKLQVSDGALCSAVTALLDSLGVSNFIFASEPSISVGLLRASVNEMIRQNEEIGSTALCIAELLMKARIAEKPKAAGSADEQAHESNPEPQARRANTALEKVKKPPKNQSARAKAHAAVQAIGSVYTIETLQI